MSYDNWKLRAPEDEPGFDAGAPLQDDVTCKGCDHFILDASDEDAHKFQGWWWCSDCYHALPEVQHARQRAASADELKDDAPDVGGACPAASGTGRVIPATGGEVSVIQAELPVVGTKEMALVPAASDPMVQMIERMASNPAVDVDKLQRLIDMHRDAMQVTAKAAFNSSFARMQAEIPTVIEKGRTDKTSYARLEDIVETVRPILQRHGFSLSHKTEWPDKATVKVIGILTHEQGHARESEFQATADQTGSKNAIQALGSSVSYGRRYTTKDLLNIVTKEEDDDGDKSDRKAIEAPIGFEDWLDDMDALVGGGCNWPTLEKTWDDSKQAYRDHIAKTNRLRVEGWKKKAKAVKSA